MVCKCKGCKKRKVGCHATCESYKEYRANIDRQNDLIRQEKKYNVNFNDSRCFAHKRKKDA